jgi:hypothetical protein
MQKYGFCHVIDKIAAWFCERSQNHLLLRISPIFLGTLMVASFVEKK